MTFGQMLKSLRKERRWTQSQLSEKIGISVIQICQLEQGKYKPSSRTLNKLVNVFGVEFETLYNATLK